MSEYHDPRKLREERFNCVTDYSISSTDATARAQGRNLQAGLEVTPWRDVAC